ncbi:hypothetical protein [Candidatus Liberibacter sp.]|uniref:hypothetical protein n=1 Tax=Candidatus Liberibacter sp. TaxID=34022 RepID=UPI0015F35E94|nr:hypothetical protein [Candidatus Liberibacter sp.]
MAEPQFARQEGFNDEDEPHFLGKKVLMTKIMRQKRSRSGSKIERKRCSILRSVSVLDFMDT